LQRQPDFAVRGLLRLFGKNTKNDDTLGAGGDIKGTGDA
jgi:hypothetical protein